MRTREWTQDEIDEAMGVNEPDEEDGGLDECGMTQDGYCMLAGTEHCDFDCPIGSRPIPTGQAPEELRQVLADALAQAEPGPLMEGDR